MKLTARSGIAGSLLLICLFGPADWAQGPLRQNANSSSQQPAQQTGQGSQVTVPSRPENPVYSGEQGPQKSEIKFVPASRTVTIKLQVQDPNGYFLPNIRRENFAVYEDGVRQKNVTVEVEHAAVSIGLLVESGGRYHELNKLLGFEVPVITRQALEVLGSNDKIGAFKYAGKLETLADFNQGREILENTSEHFSVPPVSETNFYDALLETLNRMRDITDRKAIIVVSSGADTFSKASYQQVLEAVRTSGTPIYVIGLAELMKREAATYGPTAPFARIDWDTAERQLETIAKDSGGRAYMIQSDAGLPAVYDDIMENLRIRYVVTYVSSNPSSAGPPRSIQVDLIDPQTGQALRIRDASGKPVAAKVFLQETYTPKSATG
jgi:Ca-activated chloride channel family protein